MREVFFGIIIPFIGTSLGAACVFLLAHEPGERVREVLSGLSAGVMTAASVWSLLLPSIADSERRACVSARRGRLCARCAVYLRHWQGRTDAVAARQRGDDRFCRNAA